MYLYFNGSGTLLLSSFGYAPSKYKAFICFAQNKKRMTNEFSL